MNPCHACECNQALLNEQLRIVDDKNQVIASLEAQIKQVRIDWLMGGIVTGMILGLFGLYLGGLI